jgi:hypothetical protein
MRRLAGALVTVLLVAGGCTSESEPEAKSVPTTSPAPAIGLASLHVDWPVAGAKLDVGKPPAAPEGFDDGMVARMAAILTDWARVTTIDDEVWHSSAPVDQVVGTLPTEVGSALDEQTKDAVSPELAVANVFADEVTVLGAPIATTAWKLSTKTDDAGESYVRLELQTRAAYEVRLGDDAPTRVIGMLRVHGLSAYPGTTSDFGVSGGWQEFGASDCALALDDELVPDSDLDSTVRDLKTFVTVGDGKKLAMPPLDAQERVDSEYLQRCRDGQV